MLLKKMAIAHTYTNYVSYPQDERTLTINFDNLLLAIFSSFNIDITETELLLNVQNLFADLNLAIPDSIFGDIQDSLPSLVSNQYLEYAGNKYQLSNKGKVLGLKALKNFKNSIQKLIKK